ncbi:MAG: sulfur carrier protein ThiS [Bacteroidales bacterium]|jgi:sulfur carrier protein|nr:sulfur carrier protein ThiS [Bacteroidales bacterium]
MSKITVNGEAQDVTLPLSLPELITLNNVLQPDMVSIQINGEFINRDNFAKTAINEGDEIDFLYFMGGGAL